MKYDIKGTAPCAVCGAYPIIQGGLQSHAARLVCPNYKDAKVQHGNLSCETKGIPMGFTKWFRDNWWTEEQVETKGLNELVEAWNRVHQNREYKKEN